MPELPEVETVRDGLARHVLGQQVVRAVVHHPRAVRRHPGGALDLPGRLTGRTLTAAVRRGKYLWLLLDDDASLDGAVSPGGDTSRKPSEALLVHLGMSGQLLVRRDGAAIALPPPGSLTLPAESALAPGSVPPVEGALFSDGALFPGSAPPLDHQPPVSAAPAPTTPAAPPDPRRHLRVELDLDDGSRLWFVDQRTFGHLLVADLLPTTDGGPGGHGSPVAALPEPAAHIARDPLDPTLDRAALARRLRQRRTEVKRALLDQALVSGIGNIYADEALWRVRLHPRRATDRLTQRAALEVLTAAEGVMGEALAAGGTSFDALYVDVDGAGGMHGRSLAVYGLAGHPCKRCGTPIVREKFMNRSSHFCPVCQRKR